MDRRPKFEVIYERAIGLRADRRFPKIKEYTFIARLLSPALHGHYSACYGPARPERLKPAPKIRPNIRL